MKKLLLITLLSPYLSKAQCITKKDEFTGKVITMAFVHFVPVSVLAPATLDPKLPIIYLMKVDSEKSIGLSFGGFSSKDDFDIQKMVLLVKFEDGTVKRFHSSSLTTISGAPGQMMVAFNGKVSNDDLAYFRDFKVAFIRLAFKGDEAYGFDPPIKARVAREIQEAVNCVQ